MHPWREPRGSCGSHSVLWHFQPKVGEHGLTNLGPVITCYVGVQNPMVTWILYMGLFVGWCMAYFHDQFHHFLGWYVLCLQQQIWQVFSTSASWSVRDRCLLATVSGGIGNFMVDKTKSVLIPSECPIEYIEIESVRIYLDKAISYIVIIVVVVVVVIDIIVYHHINISLTIQIPATYVLPTKVHWCLEI